MKNINVDNIRLAKNTGLLYVRSLFLLLISLYTSRIILQYLGIENYGIYNVVGGVVSMFSMLGSTLASASQRFITYSLGENNEKEVKTVFSTCMTLHFILGVIMIALLEIFGIWLLHNKLNIPNNRIFIAGWVMQISILTCFIGIISVPYNALIIAHERMGAFAYISILEGILRLIAAFVLKIKICDTLLLHAWMNLGISLINRLIYTIYSNYEFKEARNIKIYVEKKIFNEMFTFAGWNLLGNGSLVLRNQGVDIVLNMFFGVVVNAAKGVSNQVQNAVHSFIGNLTTAMKPQLTKAVAQGDSKRIFELMHDGSRYSCLLMTIFAVPIIVTTPQLLKIWLKNVPDYSVPFVRLTMVYLILDSLSRMLIHAILSVGDIRNYQIIVGGTKLLAIPLVWIMLKLGATPLSGVIVNIVLEILCLGERFYFNWQKLQFDVIEFIINVVLKCMVIVLLSIFLSFTLKYFVTENFFISAFMSVGVTTVLIIIYGMKHNERVFIVDYVSKKFFM